MISACAVVIPVFAVLMAMASFWVTCSASSASMSVALTAIPEISWSPVLMPEVFAMMSACAVVIPVFAVLMAMASF